MQILDLMITYSLKKAYVGHFSLLQCQGLVESWSVGSLKCLNIAPVHTSA